jgi:hypothetical protein
MHGIGRCWGVCPTEETINNRIHMQQQWQVGRTDHPCSLWDGPSRGVAGVLLVSGPAGEACLYPLCCSPDEARQRTPCVLIGKRLYGCLPWCVHHQVLGGEWRCIVCAPAVVRGRVVPCGMGQQSLYCAQWSLAQTWSKACTLVCAWARAVSYGCCLGVVSHASSCEPGGVALFTCPV